MKATVLIQAAAVAAFAFTAFAAHSAPRDVKTLPRVVITGKAAPDVAQLPRVVVTGYSDATLLRHTTLAAAKAPAKRG